MNIGIVGGGSIVREFLSVCRQLKDIRPVAVFTRRASVAGELSKLFNIPLTYGDYNEMLLSDALDFVYIAVPNHLHFSFAKQALLAGKNVILEKPFTVTSSEADELRAIALKSGLYLFEAISNLYTPTLAAIKESIKKIGKIHSVRADYLQLSRRYDDFKKGIIHPVFDPKMHGGVMMDLGVYCLHPLLYLFGEPRQCEYIPKIEKGIDTEGAFRLDFEGFSASGKISKAADGECGLFIKGENGTVESRGKPNIMKEAVITISGESTTFCGNDDSERLVYEWNAFAEIYQSGCYDRMRSMLECTCRVADVLEKFKRV